MTSKISQLAGQLVLYRKQSNLGCPVGWMTVRDIQHRLKFITTNSTSNKAKILAEHGFLDRRKYQTKSESGTLSWCYAYRPALPHKSFEAIVIAAKSIGQDKVPKGWISVSDFVKLAYISREAVFQMAKRHSLEFKYFRVKNGEIGAIKPVTHFRLSSLKRLHKLQG